MTSRHVSSTDKLLINSNKNVASWQNFKTGQNRNTRALPQINASPENVLRRSQDYNLFRKIKTAETMAKVDPPQRRGNPPEKADRTGHRLTQDAKQKRKKIRSTKAKYVAVR